MKYVYYFLKQSVHPREKIKFRLVLPFLRHFYQRLLYLEDGGRRYAIFKVPSLGLWLHRAENTLDIGEAVTEPACCTALCCPAKGERAKLASASDPRLQGRVFLLNQFASQPPGLLISCLVQQHRNPLGKQGPELGGEGTFPTILSHVLPSPDSRKVWMRGCE